MSLRPTFKKEELRAGCGISSKYWSTLIDLFPGKSVSRSCFSKLQLCVPCSRGSVKYCHGGCLRPQAEPRVPPAPTRRSTILDLVSQSGDHHLLFMLLKQVLRSVNNNQRWFYVLHEKSLSLSLPSTPSNSSSIHNSLIWTYLLCNKYSLSLLFTRLPW